MWFTAILQLLLQSVPIVVVHSHNIFVGQHYIALSKHYKHFFTHCEFSKICKIHLTITICFSCLLPHKFAQFAFCLQWNLSGRQLHFFKLNCLHCEEAQTYQLNFAA